MSAPRDILPDVLEPGLKIVFCGMAAGKKSAAVGAYYAGPGNRFWHILHETGLTPRQLQPQEFRILPEYGIGLTDIEKHQIGNDDELDLSQIMPNRLRASIAQVTPRVLAFSSKSAAQQFYRRGTLHYGLQPETLGITAIWVLPSTSARNAHWPRLVQHWFAFADWLAETEPTNPSDASGIMAP